MAATETKRPAQVAAVRRVEAMQLRVAGHSQQVVAEKLGVSQQRVSEIEREWLEARKPSAEVTEERRQQQLEGIDSIRARLWSALESEPELAVRLAVVDRIEKLWNREARLVGLDLERNVTVNLLPTAEQFASALGWAGDDVIEGTAVELPAGDDA